ncbi:MAG: 50S ribosomal protein L1 [Opitutales bacterium]|nr:50S ribosomal protein L1 [Opitutales bacterium]
MNARSKRYKNTFKENLSDSDLPQAIEKLSAFEKVKFDETVEVSMSLGVDPKQTSQAVRGVVNLPHGSGKEIKVLVFTENPEEAIKQGADFAGLEDLIAKVKDGWMDFDVALATTSAMKSVRSIARVLGPRGLMPTPKAGTVTDDVESGIKEVKAGRVEFKMDKTGAIAVIIGKRSFSQQQLQENAETAIGAITSSRPEGFKGKFIKSIFISSSMSPSVKVSLTPAS